MPSKPKEQARFLPVKKPDFGRRRVLILPGAFYGSIVQMFASVNCRRATDVEDADFVVFAGGEDINPALYGEKALPQTYFNEARDASEIVVYNKCLRLNIPMIGICRGAQFLHAMNGGTLWQHTSGHAGQNHDVVDLEDDVVFSSSSVHHQMLRKNDKMDLIAVANEQISKIFQADGYSMNLMSEETEEIEIEACAYVDTKCFMTQGHPEIGPDDYTNWFLLKTQTFLQDDEACPSPSTGTLVQVPN